MTSTEQQVRERHFVEQMGLLFDELAAPRMLGKITGDPLICQPEHQSSVDIADYLDASRGTVSTMTRQLLQMGMIEKVPMQGSRATFFRMRPHAWSHMMRIELARLRIMRETAERGLEILARDPPARRKRLEHFREFYVYMERELPAIVDGWDAQHAKEKA